MTNGNEDAIASLDAGSKAEFSEEVGLRLVDHVDDFSGDGMRKWYVTFRSRTGARFREAKRLTIDGMAGDVDRDGWIENQQLRNNSGGVFTEGLVFCASGPATGAFDAIDVLGEQLGAWANMCAVASNAAFEDEYEVLAYAPPVGDLPGRYLSEKACPRYMPSVIVRNMPINDLVELMDALQSYSDKDYLLRAMAHYRHALSHHGVGSELLAMEHLYIAAETMQHPIINRLIAEFGNVGEKKSKRELAQEAGFKDVDPNEPTNIPLNAFDSYIRLHHIFNDDEDCYKALKWASEKFEHGSSKIGQIQRKIKPYLAKAYRYVRHGILRELGISISSNLYSSFYDEPLGVWLPQLWVTGNYVAGSGDGESRFHGLNFAPYVESISDDEETKQREIVLRVVGNGKSLLGNQTANILETCWMVPKVSPSEVISDTENTGEQDFEIALTIGKRHQSPPTK